MNQLKKMTVTFKIYDSIFNSLIISDFIQSDLYIGTALTNLDTLPNANNYRNLLSFIGGVNKRPTLSELQVRIDFYQYP